MELTAALEALGEIEGPVHVVSDSTYVVNCFRDGWWQGWLKRGWKNSKKEPVANRDLWEPLIELYESRDVTFEWVKGHSGNMWNELADRLAVAAIPKGIAGEVTAIGLTQNESDGTGRAVTASSGQGELAFSYEDDVSWATSPQANASPSVPDAADPARGVSARTSEPNQVVNHGADADMTAVAVIGHKPPALGGYEPNPVTAAVRSRLKQLLLGLKAMNPEIEVLTGLGLGAEQLAAQAAIDADVGFVAVLAFPDPELRWPQDARALYRSLLESAVRVELVSNSAPKSPREAASAFARRDAWLKEHSSQLIAVWDRADDSLAQTVRDFEIALDDAVWIVDPREFGH